MRDRKIYYCLEGNGLEFDSTDLVRKHAFALLVEEGVEEEEAYGKASELHTFEDLKVFYEGYGLVLTRRKENVEG